MIQKGLKSNNNKIIIIISIIAVLLILLLIFFTQKNVNVNDDNIESINSESSENIENSDKSDNSVINDNIKDNVSVSTTAPTAVVEESAGNNPGFEEEESLDENDSKSGGSTVSRDPEKEANQTDNPSTTEPEHSTINEDPTDAEQDPTENETTGLPPKAPSQAGEWGNPIKN